MKRKKLSLFLPTALIVTSFLGLIGCAEDNENTNPNQQQPTKVEQAKQETPKQETPKNQPPKQESPTAPATVEKNGDTLVPNPNDILVLVNKKRHLPSDYVPPDLIEPHVTFSFSGQSPKKTMRQEAAKALEKLFEASQAAGMEMVAQSGYRSYSTQKQIYAANFRQMGEIANQYSAQAGQSEHQTGLAMDVTCAEIGFSLEEEFADTKEGKWLAKNCAQFGFIIRYQKGKENITGYAYEPWHIRYVGKKAAQEIMEKGITLEEYLSR